MAITLADFNKIWASTSPLTPYSFSESNYKQGWNFIGSTPPARQMWDFLQKQNDEKMQYIVNDICVPTEIDETSASGDYYSYPVPTGKVFANFKTLGGKTVAFNQVNFNSSSSETFNGVTFTNNANGSWTLNGTSIGSGGKIICQTTSVAGHKYLFKGCPSGGSSTTYSFGYNGNIVDTGNGGITTSSIDVFNIRFDIRAVGVVFNNVTVYLCVFDLTQMFGAGNEPSTVAEFEAMFPASYYAYTEGTLLSAGIKEVIAKDSSNNVVATMPIPSAVQSLEGYGWSAGSVYNYIDYERKVFVKRVAKFVIDSSYTPIYTEDYSDTANNAYCYRFNGISVFPNSRPAVTQYFVYDQSLPSNKNPYTFTVSQYGFYCITNHATLEAFTTWLSTHPITVYYELATPVETDISSILGAVGIACGNTLTFDYDDDYKLPVPVSMDLIDNKYGMMTAQDKAKLDVVYDYIQRVSGN